MDGAKVEQSVSDVTPEEIAREVQSWRNSDQ
jgi:hypothetical protein